MTITDLFDTNASIVRDLAKAAADAAPEANLLVISNPVSQRAGVLAPQWTLTVDLHTGQLHCSHLRRSLQIKGCLQPETSVRCNYT